jgi:hypothetical protein
MMRLADGEAGLVAPWQFDDEHPPAPMYPASCAQPGIARIRIAARDRNAAFMVLPRSKRIENPYDRARRRSYCQ